MGYQEYFRRSYQVSDCIQHQLTPIFSDQDEKARLRFAIMATSGQNGDEFSWFKILITCAKYVLSRSYSCILVI